MSTSFYFYDLETSGFNPREARIMQFGGQRTNLDMEPIGDPHNVLIKLSEDVLPEPDAILVTGITPQQTKANGITEAEFLKIFAKEIAVPGTIFVGFNSVRFDDEFMRYLHYRNFYDPYEWQWQDSKSRWDMLDVVRMTRALRPDGIKWPVDAEGKPGNRLESLASINKLEHSNAHDALSDVQATIGLAKLLKTKQPKLFEYLLTMRDKKSVAKLVDEGQPFVYTSGKYDGKFAKTTVVTKLAQHPKKQGALVYDLRFDPTEFASLSPQKLAEAWVRRHDDPAPKLPVKTLQFNRCPAVAPLGVLDEQSQKRIGIDLDVITANAKKLKQHPEFIPNLQKALEILDKKQQTVLLENTQTVDAKLYDGFFETADKTIMRAVRAGEPDEISQFSDKLTDNRLVSLLPLYKARNFKKSLTSDEQMAWDEYCASRLTSGSPSRVELFFERLAALT